MLTAYDVDTCLINKQIDRIGITNQFNNTYCVFSIAGESTRFCFNVSDDYGKNRYAWLLTAKNNSSYIDVYVSHLQCALNYFTALPYYVKILKETRPVIAHDSLVRKSYLL